MGTIKIPIAGTDTFITIELDRSEKVITNIASQVTERAMEFVRKHSSIPRYHHVLCYLNVEDKEALGKPTIFSLDSDFDKDTHYDSHIDNIVSNLYRAASITPQDLRKHSGESAIESYGLQDIDYPTVLGIQITFLRALTIPEIFRESIPLDDETIRVNDSKTLGKILMVDCTNYFPNLSGSGGYQDRKFGAVTLGTYTQKEGDITLNRILLNKEMPRR